METPKKSPAFQLYAQDFISSLDVQTMSAAEVGAYCLLLFNSWIAARQGYIPNNERQLQHISRLSPEEWKQSKKLLLSKFPATPDGKYRYNPRLAAEADKQADFRIKQAENGKRGGRPKREEGPPKPAKSEEKPSLSGGLISLNPEKALPSSSSTSSSFSEENKSIAEPGGELATPSQSATDSAKELKGGGRAWQYHYDEAPVFRSKAFNAYLDSIGYSHVDKAMYLLRISNGANKAVEQKKLQPQATNDAWQVYIQRWLDGDKKKGSLLLPDATTTTTTTGNHYNPGAALGPPATTGYSITERVRAQATKVYI